MANNNNIKFKIKMQELELFLKKEARNNNRNYDTLMLGAMNGILAYHSLITSKDVPFHDDIDRFEDMLGHE